MTEEPDRWFDCVDAEGDGKLSRKQVTDALTAAFPIHADKLEELLPSLWQRWDLDGSGFVSKGEFVARGALRDFASMVAARVPSSPCERAQHAADVAIIPPPRSEWVLAEVSYREAEDDAALAARLAEEEFAYAEQERQQMEEDAALAARLHAGDG